MSSFFSRVCTLAARRVPVFVLTDLFWGRLIAAVFAGIALGSAIGGAWSACAVFLLFAACVLAVSSLPTTPTDHP